MARRRYQRGSVFLRGKKNQVWVGRWREDVLGADGSAKRIRKNEVLGTRKEFTQKLALRELERRIGPINDRQYHPLRDENFSQFAAWWKKNVLPNHRPSTQSAIRSQLKTALIPHFGAWPMKDINYTALQSFVRTSEKSPKTRKNYILTLQIMWHAAKDGSWVTHSPFGRIKYPPKTSGEQPLFTPEEARQVILAAEGQYKTLYWIAAETGLRSGELAGLRIQNLDLDNMKIHVTHSVWNGQLQEPKTRHAKRSIALSDNLTAHIRSFLQVWKPNAMNYLFTSSIAGPIYPSTVCRANLKPLCKKLGILGKSLKAFRHCAATMMDHANVPQKVQQERLGHAPGSKVTMEHYTHSLPAGHRAAAVAVGEMLTS